MIRHRTDARVLSLVLSCAIVGAAPAMAETFTLLLSNDDEELFEQIERTSLSKAALEREDSTGADVVAAAKADYRRILEALYANGRFDTVISILVDGREAASLSPFLEFPNLPEIEVRVETGPEFTFGQTDISPLAPGTELPEEFYSGAQARSVVIRDAVSAGVTGWRNAGHPRAELAAQDLRANHRQRQLDVDLDLAPGPQLRFGELFITGAERMDARRIRKIAALPTGEVYSPDELQDAQRRLVNTGVFRSVALVESGQDNPDGTIDITAELQEEKLRRIGGGAEVGSSDGITVSAFWFHRNLLGGGERLRFDAEINRRLEGNEALEYSLGATFRRPATPLSLTDLVLGAEVARDDNDDFREDRVEVEMLFERIFSDALTVTAGLRFTATETDFKPGTQNFVTFGVPFQTTYDVRDFETNAKDGYYIQTELFPFYGTEDADSGVRFYLDTRFYESFGADDQMTFAVRGQVGSVFGPETGSVPESFLFLSGGSGTVRGQPYESLGVETPRGTFGGTEFAALNLEMRYEMANNFGVVGFYDIGYVGDDSTSDSHSGAGLGIRYNTPIGPLRLDVAVPVDGTTNDGVQLYFGIGQAF